MLVAQLAFMVDFLAYDRRTLGIERLTLSDALLTNNLTSISLRFSTEITVRASSRQMISGLVDKYNLIMIVILLRGVYGKFGRG